QRQVPVFVTEITRSSMILEEDAPPQAEYQRMAAGASAMGPLFAQASLAEPVSAPPKREPTPIPFEYIRPGCRFTVGDIEIDAFTIPHDASDPVAFSFRAQGLRAAVCTDLGYVPESVKHQLYGCQILVLESNHDLEMLKVGPYPWHIKQRVMSRTGHLSNLAVADYLEQELDAGTQVLVLAHL